MAEVQVKNHAAFIWSVADLLRGDYKQSEYGKVILPLTVLRRFDCVLAPTKDAVLKQAKAREGKVVNVAPILEREAGGFGFYNDSPLDFQRLLDDPAQLAGNLRQYIAHFSSEAREVVDKFRFDEQITKLAQANLLYMVVSKFVDIDLHPDTVSNLEMGHLCQSTESLPRFFRVPVTHREIELVAYPAAALAISSSRSVVSERAGSSRCQ